MIHLNISLKTKKRIIARIPHILFILTVLIALLKGYTMFCIGVVVGWSLCAVAWELWNRMTRTKRKVIKIKSI